MNFLWIGYLLAVIGSCVGTSVQAQGEASLEKTTRLTDTRSQSPDQPDSARSTQPKSLTFTASTDQRFFFFRDTRNENNRPVPVSVYGIRAGFLFPARRKRDALQGGRSASFKAGVGFYFINQQLDKPGLLPNTSESVIRRLRYATVYYERYLLRRKAF